MEDFTRYDQIDLYIKGLLKGKDLDIFKTLLKNDPTLHLEVESQRALIEGIKIAREEDLRAILKGEKSINYKEEVKEIKPEIKVETEIPINTFKDYTNNHSNTNQFVFLNRFKWPIAAILVAGLGFFLFNTLKISTNKTLTETKLPETTTSQSENIPLKDSIAKKDTIIPKTKDSIKKMALDTHRVKKDDNQIVKIEDDGIKQDKKLKSMQLRIPSYEINENNTNVNIPSTSKIITVEHWESIVNFKGYKFSDQVLQIYGADPDNGINLRYINNKLFMKKGDQYYKLSPSGNFEILIKETNAQILDQLQTLDQPK